MFSHVMAHDFFSVLQSIDDVIASLMSMGFEYTDCQDAITFGKNTVQAAVEW